MIYKAKQGIATVSISGQTVTAGSDGKLTDTVTYEKEKAAETVEKLKEEGKDTARIVIPESDKKVAEYLLRIPTASIQGLSDGGINLRIDTG